MPDKSRINILMADDDADDRYFFAKALKIIPIPTTLVTVEDGGQLMDYLTKKGIGQPPDLLFLDINMPRKNGYECLLEIKANVNIKNFPVVMYSTSLRDEMTDMLFQSGAHHYLRKSDLADLTKYLQMILTSIEQNNFQKPSKEEFVLNEMRVV